MSADLLRNSDLEPRKTFKEKLQGLSNPVETVRAISSITEQDVAEIRISLQEAGFNLNISEESKNALKKHQIRNPKQGRGVAIVASVGQERAQELFDKCVQIAKDHNWTQSFPSGGIGLGLKHTMADFLSPAVLPEEERERIVTNLNNRVYRGLGLIPKKSTQTSNPPESLMELWTAMTSTSK
jgi:hypothetical protein